MKTILLLLLLGAALRATGQGQSDPFAPIPYDPWPGFGLPPAHRLMLPVPLPAPPDEGSRPHASKPIGAAYYASRSGAETAELTPRRFNRRLRREARRPAPDLPLYAPGPVDGCTPVFGQR